MRGPWADVPIASIDPRDIAAVAAQVLTADGHRGRALRLTGPQALTPAERVAILADILDRPLRFEAQGDETARAEMLEDAPAEYVDAFFRFFSNGETDQTTVRSHGADRSLARRRARSHNGQPSTPPLFADLRPPPRLRWARRWAS